jgi:hypothetical protein
MLEMKNRQTAVGDTDAEEDEPESLDVEVALLAALAARDVGGEATEAVNLGTLSETEKRALLALMQQQLEMESRTAAETSEEELPTP